MNTRIPVPDDAQLDVTLYGCQTSAVTPQLHIGTCSWKFDAWKGLVYSGPASGYLAEYALMFGCVEIDQWYWSLVWGRQGLVAASGDRGRLRQVRARRLQVRSQAAGRADAHAPEAREQVRPAR